MVSDWRFVGARENRGMQTWRGENRIEHCAARFFFLKRVKPKETTKLKRPEFARKTNYNSTISVAILLGF